MYIAVPHVQPHIIYISFFLSLPSSPLSTGAGLSAVFVAVDRLLEEMEVGQQGAGINVWGVVNSLRQQRPRMVATTVSTALSLSVL